VTTRRHRLRASFLPNQRDPMSDNVIHLKFRSPHVEDDVMAFLSCKVCRNKTYTLTHDRPDGFPLMRCAACGQHMGRMGWACDDDPLIGEAT
jgi:hypothetical protein